MPRFGFVGATYAGSNPNAEAQRSVNFFPEIIDTGIDPPRLMLVPTPGLKVFSTPNTEVPQTVTAMEINRKGPTSFAITKVQVSAGVLDLTLTTSDPRAFLHRQVICYDLAIATFANGQVITIAEATETGSSVWHVTANVPGWADYAATDDTGRLYSLGQPALTVTLDANPFIVAQTVTLGRLLKTIIPPVLPANLALNGQAVVITAFDGLKFTCPVTMGDQPLTAMEQGSVIPLSTSGLPMMRASYPVNGARLFEINGSVLFEIHQDGSFTNRGTVANDNTPASITGSAIELMIASAGKLYVYTLATDVLAAVPDYSGGGAIPDILQVAYCDGYFVGLLKASNRFIVSDPLDGSSWDASMIAEESVVPDGAYAMLVDHRELIIFGTQHTVAYYNSGNTFPFDVVPSGYIDQGCAAPFSPVRIDNTPFWLGQDERGGRVAYRAAGYTPVRISNHAVEHQWSKYATVFDAVGYGFQMDGHSFYHLYFPTANKSWRYDVATKMWHEVESLTNGTWGAHRSQIHAYCWGKHLVGDWASGNIYEMSSAYFDDAGQPIRRFRRAAHVSDEQERIFHDELKLHLEAGNTAQPPMFDDQGNMREPQVMLRWSDDGGHTWSNEHWMGAGFAGQYSKRVIWRRLGSSRDRIYEVSVSDPIAWRMVDAYLKVSKGTR